MKEENKILFVSMIIGILFVFMAFSFDLGINATIYTLSVLALFLYSYKTVNKLNLTKGWFLLLAIILLSFNFFIKYNIIQIFNFFVLLTLGIIYAIHMLGKDKFKLTLTLISDTLECTLLPIGNLSKPFKVLKKIKALKISQMNNKNKGILFGIIAGIPILLILISLMASADDIFSNLFTIDLSWIDKFIFVKFIIWTLITIYTFSFFYYILSIRKIEKNNIIEKTPIDVQLKNTMITTILILLNIVFIIFTIIQFRYLFSGDNITIIEKFTYSHYARKGFFELTVISIINIGLILLFNHHSDHKLNKILMSIMSINTLIIAYSAVFRMDLYISIYGYTWLRFISLSFIYLQMIQLIITLTSVWIRKVDAVTILSILYLTSYITVNYINVDSIIINGNMNRYYAGEELDTYYFYDLSYDAIEPLIKHREILMTIESSELVIEKIDGFLLSKERKIYNESFKWYHFNLAKLKAKDQLENIKK